VPTSEFYAFLWFCLIFQANSTLLTRKRMITLGTADVMVHYHVTNVFCSSCLF